MFGYAMLLLNFLVISSVFKKEEESACYCTWKKPSGRETKRSRIIKQQPQTP